MTQVRKEVYLNENFWKNELIYGGCYRKLRVNEGISMRDKECIVTYGMDFKGIISSVLIRHV